MVSSHEQFSITNSLLTLTKQNPLISTVASYRSVNLDYQRDRETYPSEDTLYKDSKTPVFMHWGFYFAKNLNLFVQLEQTSLVNK